MLTLIAATLLSAVPGTLAKTVTYPPVEGREINDAFKVNVRCVGSPEWEDVTCYAVSVDRVDNGKHCSEKSSFCSFDFSGEVEVRVTSAARISQTRIRPLSYGIEPSIQGDTIRFTLDRPRNLSIEVNGDIFHNLLLFANPISKDRPDRKQIAKDRSLIYFGPGCHRLEGGRMDIPSNTRVYVDGGAWVEGTLCVRDAENVKISGRGMVRPERGYGVEIKGSKNVEVEGLVVTQCPVGASDGVIVRNVKSITHYGWGDGMNVFASSNVLFDGVFCRNSDDCTTVYATRLGHVGGCSNISMINSTLWADVAHPVFIGLHGAASYKKDVAERGLPYAEDPDEVILRHDIIENVTYRNIDILDHAERQIDYQGCMAIACGDNNIVRNVLFEDIRVEDIRTGQLLSIRILHNQKYCQAPGLSVSGITFRNVSYNGTRSEMSHIEGYDCERMVSNVVFENLVINGLHISDDMPEKPKWYKTGDFARILIGSHTDNITFR
ncbi:MAG: endo-polygalacturonase [Bacteroidales bacterium]|nr:endo-polygalacturonase [Bacteroidales bacterium]